MNVPRLAAIAFTLFAGWAGPAPAATVDYALTVPLVDISSDSTTATDLLLGTLSYDNSDGGVSTFSPFGSADVYAGWALLMTLDATTTGIFFDGYKDEISELFFNIAAGVGPNAIVSGPVNVCSVGCAMFKSVGATMASGAFQVSLPPGGGASSGPVVSPVPLPPAANLFLGALAALAGVGAGRRLALRPRALRI